jgi:acetolactate synthase-1/2/3 large subunit
MSQTHPNTMHGGQILANALVRQGVEIAFGVPGESFLPLLDGLVDHQERLRFITCRQEGGAAYMAEAYAKLTGKPGVVMVTRGPGAANALIGVHTAYQDSTPMVVLIGQVGTDMVEREAFQEMDYRKVYSECSKWVGSIDRTDRIDEFVSHAFHLAQSGRKGPVVLALPEDVLFKEAQEKPTPAAQMIATGLDQTLFANAMQQFANAKRPMVIAGGGSWTKAACNALSAWANREQVPVATSFRSQDLLDNLDPCFAGDLGIAANPALVKRVQEADMLLVIGERLGEMTMAGYTVLTVPKPQMPLIHVLPSPDELGRVYYADYPICASPHAFSKPTTIPGPVQLSEIVSALQSHLPRNAILTNGAGNFAAFLHRFYPYGGFKSQLAPANGSMGYGLPAAIAAKIVDPTRVAVAFCGDGDFMMNCQELATAMRYQAKPIVIIVNNGMYGTIRMHQEREYKARVSGTELTNPNFIDFAKSFSMPAYRVEKTEQFALAIQEALKSPDGAIIEIVIDPEAISPSKRLSELGR